MFKFFITSQCECWKWYNTLSPSPCICEIWYLLFRLHVEPSRNDRGEESWEIKQEKNFPFFFPPSTRWLCWWCELAGGWEVGLSFFWWFIRFAFVFIFIPLCALRSVFLFHISVPSVFIYFLCANISSSFHFISYVYSFFSALFSVDKFSFFAIPLSPQLTMNYIQCCADTSLPELL